MTLRLKVDDVTATDIAPLTGAARVPLALRPRGPLLVYSEGVTEENYLRGVQETAADGTVQFTTIFPACYDGRWPHMHFEVYQSLASATSYSNKLRRPSSRSRRTAAARSTASSTATRRA